MCKVMEKVSLTPLIEVFSMPHAWHGSVWCAGGWCHCRKAAGGLRVAAMGCRYFAADPVDVTIQSFTKNELVK